eukprot:828549-Rhodomonas_salina.1
MGMLIASSLAECMQESDKDALKEQYVGLINGLSDDGSDLAKTNETWRDWLHTFLALPDLKDYYSEEAIINQYISGLRSTIAINLKTNRQANINAACYEVERREAEEGRS